MDINELIRIIEYHYLDVANTNGSYEDDLALARIRVKDAIVKFLDQHNLHIEQQIVFLLKNKNKLT